MNQLTGIYDEDYAAKLAASAIARQGRDAALAWAGKMAKCTSAEQRNFCPQPVYARVAELIALSA